VAAKDGSYNSANFANLPETSATSCVLDIGCDHHHIHGVVGLMVGEDKVFVDRTLDSRDFAFLCSKDRRSRISLWMGIHEK
jgi:hypothetical protein